MKKNINKIPLKRETLRQLTGAQLGNAHGGVFTDLCGSDQGTALCTLGGCTSGGGGGGSGGPPHTFDLDCPPRCRRSSSTALAGLTAGRRTMGMWPRRR